MKLVLAQNTDVALDEGGLRVLVILPDKTAASQWFREHSKWTYKILGEVSLLGAISTYLDLEGFTEEVFSKEEP